MIHRTPITAKPPVRKQLLAAGSIGAGERDLRAASLFAPHTQVIEHRVVKWTNERWIAEVRVNERMTHRSIFTGEYAHFEAIAWCEGIAPHATRSVYAPPIYRDEVDDAAWREEIEAEIALHDTIEAELDDLIEGRLDEEWIRQGC